MKTQALKIKSAVTGKETAVTLQIASYGNNGSLYIGLYSKRSKEYYDDITINLPEDLNPLPDKDCAYIKNDFGSLEDFLETSGLAEDTGWIGVSGLSVYKLYKFDSEKLREQDPEGYEKYLQEQE